MYLFINSLHSQSLFWNTFSVFFPSSSIFLSFIYLAPELHQGDDGKLHSDVYSFGILLWCAFTQRVPFANENPNCIGRIVLSEKRRPEYTMSELARIPQDIDLIQLMISCWKKQGSDRPTIDKVRNQTNIILQSL